MLRNLIDMDGKGEENWWTQVKHLLPKYGLPEDLSQIKELSKETFKRQVKQAISSVVFNELCAECTSLKKTANLKYECFEMQNYLQELYPSQAKLVLKSRCKLLDIKTHCSYKYNDTVCRGCGVEEETLDHIINCGQQEELHVDVTNINGQEGSVVTLNRAAGRIASFIDQCDEAKTATN